MNDAPDPVGGRSAQRKGKQKKPSTSLFKEMNDSFQNLSVTEKVRLVKQLAGQIGLVAVGPDQIVGIGAKEPPKLGAQRAKPAPSPWKNLPEKKAVDDAYKALVDAKKQAGTDLPASHPLVVAYNAAVSALVSKKKEAKNIGSKRIRTDGNAMDVAEQVKKSS